MCPHRKRKPIKITLDPKILKEVKQRTDNVSRYVEDALKQKLSFSADAFFQKGSWWTRRDLNPGPSPCEVPPFLEKNVDEKTSDDFLKNFERTMRVAWGLADSTIKCRMRTAKRLVQDFGHPLKVSREDILDFIEKYGTQNTYKGVRVIYGRYFNLGVVDDVKIPQSEPKPKEIPSDRVIKDVFYNLPNLDHKTAYLILASSGLRRGEMVGLTPEEVDYGSRMLTPNKRTSTKRTWISFYNEEAEKYLKKLGRLPDRNKDIYTQRWREKSDGRITPQTLRSWFADKMGRLGVSDRYIDAFCGRVPKSVLGKHYTDFSPRRLKEIYESADLTVLK